MCAAGSSPMAGGPSILAPFGAERYLQSVFRIELAGDSASAAPYGTSGETVHRLGGLEHSNSYVRFYLALVGAVGWELVPSIPPEFMLLPTWSFMSIYEMSSWTRGIVIPMAILCTLRPDWRLPERACVDEFVCGPHAKGRGI